MFFGEVTATDQIVIAPGNESVPIQLAQCRLPGLAIFSAKILIYFFKYNVRKQLYQTALANCCGLKSRYEKADCSPKLMAIAYFCQILTDYQNLSLNRSPINLQ